tara:strand:+ start:172 stop:393 length:222 start_codon:yes stop_codon:yes gene_type:complete
MLGLIKGIIREGGKVKEAFKKAKAEKKTVQTKTSTIKNKTNTIKTNAKKGATILNRFNFLTKKSKIDKKTLLG